jgi:hypothetical protein
VDDDGMVVLGSTIDGSYFPGFVNIGYEADQSLVARICNQFDSGFGSGYVIRGDDFEDLDEWSATSLSLLLVID